MENDEIAEFKFDDRFWWLRWVDFYQPIHQTGSSASVEANFCLLPESCRNFKELDTAKVLRLEGETRRARISAGYLPRLRLGTIFQNGRERGQLPLTLKSFQFNVRKRPAQLFTAWENSSRERRPGEHPYPRLPVLGRQEFRLEAPRGKWEIKKEVYCLVVEDAEKTLVIPAHEVLRSLFLPDRNFALALTSGPWEHQLDRIVNSKATKAVDPHNWHVVLRPRIRDRFAYHAANLVINEAGRLAARRIHACLMDECNPMGAFQAEIPFDLDTLRLAVRCVKLRDAPLKYLALEIAAFEWPLLNVTVHWTRDNDASPKPIEEPTTDPPPYGGTLSGRPVVNPPIRVDSTEDPNADLAGMNFPTRGLQWWNPPPLHHLNKLRGKNYIRVSKGKQPPPAKPPRTASPAGEAKNRKDRATANYQNAEHPTCPRFLRLIEVLDLLKTRKEGSKIDDWEVVEPPVEAVPLPEFVVWRFPPTVIDEGRTVRNLRWSYISKEDLLLRTALVVKIALAQQEIYWVETELRSQAGGYAPEGGYRSLLFRADATQIETIVNRALVICAQNKGIWPAKEKIQRALGVRQVSFWVHQYSESQSTEPTTSKDKPWSEASVLKALKKLLVLPKPPEKAKRNRARAGTHSPS